MNNDLEEDPPELDHYEVSLTDTDGNDFLFDCWAEDSDHAAEQAQDAYPFDEIYDINWYLE